ncbi:hypothetical protein [Roseobacter sp.]|uniref:hypothetical protein n=1 Tax=Roseobacter sp. TaxID=1907202 RepID=UPI002967450B|nr:hypothetical protein [Roseobacter sp.]MDW3183934.1 hypothetical protein [Roseobacter sp.]
MIGRCILRCLIAAYVFCPTASFGQATAFDPLFADLQNTETTQLFEFSRNGQIIDGPRAARGEPIDVSYLYRKDVLGAIFTRSVLSCLEGIRYCDAIPRRWPTKDLSIKVVAEKGTFGIDEANTISDALYFTLGQLGFAVPSEPNIEKAHIVIYAGSFEYLLQKTKQLSDNYGVDYYREWKTERDGRFSRDDYYEVSRPAGACYVSTKDFVSAEQIVIFLRPADLTKCLPISLMEIAGFGIVRGGYPTLIDDETSYKAATFADRLFAAMLYHSKFPDEPNEQALLSFWATEVDSIYVRTLNDNRK